MIVLIGLLDRDGGTSLTHLFEGGRDGASPRGVGFPSRYEESAWNFPARDQRRRLDSLERGAIPYSAGVYIISLEAAGVKKEEKSCRRNA